MTANHRPLEEGDIELIDLVRASPCLYDTKDPNFRLVYKKEQEWQSIADGLAMSHWEARKRWTVLRDRYARELKQLILHPDSTEYGKNDFFLRMDFIRNFVKKREVKRKRCYSQGREGRNQEKARPLKLIKIDSDGSNCGLEDNQSHQQEKSYIIVDSQDSSTGKFSYVEQMSQDPIEQGDDQHENVRNLEPSCGDQEYNDFVEETSATYEAVEQDHTPLTPDNSDNYMLSSSVNNSRNITIKPESTKVADNFRITTVEEQKLSCLPQLQQRPIITHVCTKSETPILPVDTEGYFSKTIASYLRQLSPRYKIKAKVEIMQIIEKYIDLEENNSEAIC